VGLPANDQMLAVHCAPSLAIKWLGPRLRGFVDGHPGLHVRLSTGADPPDLGVRRDLDAAPADGRPRAGVEVVPLGAERIAPLVGPSLLPVHFLRLKQGRVHGARQGFTWFETGKGVGNSRPSSALTKTRAS
jgi:DNA-binding transcriptional LysR family regulator